MLGKSGTKKKSHILNRGSKVKLPRFESHCCLSFLPRLSFLQLEENLQELIVNFIMTTQDSQSRKDSYRYNLMSYSDNLYLSSQLGFLG